MARVFISYKRNVEPDQSIADRVYGALKDSGHDVVLDRRMEPGTDWGGEIEDKLPGADFLVVLVSYESGRSKMVRGEVEIAASSRRTGGPKIVPVRLAYAERLPYPMNSHLDSLTYLMWRGESDTKRLLDELLSVMAGRKAADSESQSILPLCGEQTKEDSELPLNPSPPEGGPVDIEDPLYIVRQTDEEVARTIRKKGPRTLVIIGARETGKSSLLIRVIDQAIKENRTPVLLNLETFEKSIKSADEFFPAFARSIAERAELTLAISEIWDSGDSNSDNCTRCVEKHVLRKINTSMTLAIDHADFIYSSPFRNDFFGMLRSWHNNRADPVKRAIWRKMDLAIVTSIEPNRLVDRSDQSPFNVGTFLRMQDLSIDQVQECNRLHRSPLFKTEVQKLHELVGGHPHLVRRALYLVSGSSPMTPDNLFESAADETGPFGDHLWQLLVTCRRSGLQRQLYQIVRDHQPENEDDGYSLLREGLVNWEDGKFVIRCRLYGDYFRKRLNPTRISILALARSQCTPALPRIRRLSALNPAHHLRRQAPKPVRPLTDVDGAG